MAFSHRKAFLQYGDTPSSPRSKCCVADCPHYQPTNSLPPEGLLRYPPPDLSRWLLRDDKPHQTHQGTQTLLFIFCGLGIFWAMVCCIPMLAKYYSISNYFRRRNSPESDDTDEDFVDQSRGFELVHPIWYVNTVGLQQSDIDSIAVFKYKRDDGLIEGTECSVCLGEFQEDESLRLLPKCSHAFHIPCIDTWLRSHKNCPLCRSLVVTDRTVVHMNAEDSNMDDRGLREDAGTENLETSDRLGNLQLGGDGRSETGENSEDGEPTHELCVNGPNVEQEVQPLRRSVSMDSSSASMIYAAIANIPQVGHDGRSATKIVPVKKANSETLGKKVGGNSSIYEPMKNSSVGSSMPKRCVSMKRSFSSGGKVSLTRHGRRQGAVQSFCAPSTKSELKSYHSPQTGT